jgi:adenine-specific DNA-methyltransferase
VARQPRTQVAVETLRHPDEVTRLNIPTAETSGLLRREEEAAQPMLYPRNPDLDPQLVWRGKDAQDAAPLAVDTVPIYIQEKVKPEALIRDLRRQSRGCPPQANLFGDFDRIDDPEMRLDFYQHAENWSNRMILGDSLLVMNSLAEKEGLRGQVQMIYLDPPFGISFSSNWQPSTRQRTVGDSGRDQSREPEQIKAFRDTWKDGINSYLAYWRDRFAVARELLSETGSIFVQIGDENVHRIRCVLDEIFGPDCAVVTVLLKKKGSQRSTLIDPVNDYILWYSKSPRGEGGVKFHALFERRELDLDTLEEFTLVELSDGSEVRLADLKAPDGTDIDYRLRPQRIRTDYPGARLFRHWPITNGGERANQMDPVDYRGAKTPPPTSRCWSHPSRWEGGGLSPMQRVVAAGRLVGTTAAPQFKRYLDDFPFKIMSNWWDGLGGASRPIYVVQTNEEVVRRCMLMTTDPGDLVLDPTCGSGTTAYVAEQWGRRWITIDTSRVALALARTRLTSALHPPFYMHDSAEGAQKEAELSGRPNEQRRFRRDIREGFVFERAPQITSTTVANAAEIDLIDERWREELDSTLAALNDTLGSSYKQWEVPRSLPESASDDSRKALAQFWKICGARQKEIDAAIRGNAEPKVLYNHAYEQPRMARVTGPFTVESLSPHRVLPLPGDDDPALLDAISDETGELPPRRPLRAKTEAPAGDDFVTVVIDNLLKAGVQNTKKNERMVFATVRPWPGQGHVAAEGIYEEAGQQRRAAIVIGPEYGTVGQDLVRQAVRECRDWADSLVVCGFAFDPQVGESTMNFGRLTVLKARMSQELHAADAYKSGGGNLFTVFGEPDIGLDRGEDGSCVVRLKGVDIFDPTTGEVRSSKEVEDDIACWFVDSDYDGDSFFVRHAYFLGGKDPYEKLKAALRAEIDPDAWSTLYSAVSRAFAPPKSGHVAVKVINHYGDEAMKVFRVT